MGNDVMAMHGRHGSIDIEVTVKREDLLERLRANREKHEVEFEQAISAWQAELARVLESTNSGACLEFPHSLDQLREDCPVSHLLEYDQAIDMFTMCVREQVKLDSDAFNTFCRDEWGWKSSVSRNRFYRSVEVAVVSRNS
ncbi:MAG: hypothetical protein N2C14_03535 [Planctomycetales bacterium]